MDFYYENIPLVNNSTYIVREFEVSFINFPMHFHPEFELNYIQKSTGKRFVGDHIGDFEDGELVLVGSGLPHKWKNDISYYTDEKKAKSIVLQFHEKFLGNGFLERSEAVLIKRLLQNANRGISFPTATGNKILPLLENLLHLEGFEGMMVFLQIIHELSKEKEFKLLSSSSFEYQGKKDELSHTLFEYLAKNSENYLPLEKVAENFNMSSSGFSHYFKKKTGKTYSYFMNEIRIGKACMALMQNEKNVAEIAFSSGFNNLSYFNRKFKEFKKMTPQEFREQFNLKT